MVINMIAAVDYLNFGIGKDGGIPWENKEDMKWFKKMTTGNAVIMGHKTWESLNKPLKDRLNIVITSHNIDANPEDANIVRIARNPEEAVSIAEQEKYNTAFVIGGASIYKSFLERKLVDSVYLDYITLATPYDYDTFFPMNLITNWETCHCMWDVSKLINPEFPTLDCHVFHKINENISKESNFKYVTTDSQYIDMLENIYKNGHTKHTRAGDTLSVFPYHMEFDLSKGLPILTTKKVFAKGCIHELLWFLKGGTNIKYLLDNDVHIWDDDAYRYYVELDNAGKLNGKLMRLDKEAFLDFVKRGESLPYWRNDDAPLKDGETVPMYHFGDLGPIYGKQWTNWNGVNQIDDLIYKLKNNPDDRRLIVSSWNVGEMKDMALPPCHYMSQWYTTEITFDERLKLYFKMAGDDAKGSDNKDYMIKVMNQLSVPKYKLSCMWSQRSVDACLGFPYDLLSYSILVHMVAQVTNMIPDKLYCTLGDTHIYKNQIDDAIVQMQRNPFKFEYPTLELNKDIKNIYDFKYEDIHIINYKSYPSIKYKLSVGLSDEDLNYKIKIFS